MKKMKKGFTIVELVIVIGVIAILSAVLIPTFTSLTSNAKIAKAQSEVADAYTSYIIEKGDQALAQDKVLAEYDDGTKIYFLYSAEGWVKQASKPASGYETSAISPDGNASDHVQFYAKTSA